MNLLLFKKPFEQQTIDGSDPRAEHLRKVLRVSVGSLVFVGFVNGLRARARVIKIGSDSSVSLEVVGTESAPKPLPISLLIGLPRPHTAKRILFEAASMGVERIDFFEAENGEPSYGESSLWKTEAWMERLELGAEQAFSTHIPQVSMYPDLQTALSSQAYDSSRVALDNYEAEESIAQAVNSKKDAAVLALGSERGWSDNERNTLRRNGWTLAHLGPQVLRAETAVVAAVSSAASVLGAWKKPTATEL